MRVQTESEIDVMALPSLPLGQRREFPMLAAVYLVLRDGRVLYVGRSGCLQKRWISHHKRELLKDTDSVAWLEGCDISKTEHSLIRKFRPPLNNQRRTRIRFSYVYVGGAMVTAETKKAIERIAESDECTVTYVIRRAIMENPRVKAELRNGKKRR